MASKPKNLEEMSDDEREAWRVKDRERQRKWREANPEKKAERSRKWYEANREKISEQKRKYREANRQELAEKCRKYKKANREKVLEGKLKYYAKLRTQADADRFFQLMNAANEITKAISEINQSNEI
jgi:hypothetical protein